MLLRLCPRPYSLRSALQSYRRRFSETTEIERKFIFNEAILSYCKKYAVSARDISMRDVYFDNDSFDITTRDMWLRQRNEKMELKWPVVHDIVQGYCGDGHQKLVGLDFYQESTDTGTIGSVLSHLANVKVPLSTATESLQEAIKALDNAGVRPFGTILTRRTRYNVSIDLPSSLRRPDASSVKVFVDIDAVHYAQPSQELSLHPPTSASSLTSYNIGEIEFNFEQCSDSRQSNKGRDEAVMHHVFSALGIEPTPVRGKVLEYLVRFRPQHYEALRASGQLATKGL